jgi:flagellar hook-basal body complex protein FliE
MAIAPIPGVGGALPTLPTLPTLPSEGTQGAAGGKDFGNAIAGALDNLGSIQAKADQLGVQAATGQLTDVHDYLIAATQASLATEMTVAVRNKALEAFNSIMQMNV